MLGALPAGQPVPALLVRVGPVGGTRNSSQCKLAKQSGSNATTSVRIYQRFEWDDMIDDGEAPEGDLFHDGG